MRTFPRICFFLLVLICLARAPVSAAQLALALPPPPTGTLPAKDMLTATADESSYDDAKDCYVLKGHVRIEIGKDVTLTTDEAQISSDTRAIWAKNAVTLTEDDCTFTGEGAYVNVVGQSASFYGHPCKLTRTGLSIQSDTMQYQRNAHLVIFDGHVLCIQEGKEKAATHLEYDIEKNAVR